jgi:hypothetical protein
MNLSYDPLQDPEIAVRILQRQKRNAAIASIIFGAFYFLLWVWFVTRRTSLMDRINLTSGVVSGIMVGGCIALVIRGIQVLVRGDTTLKLVLELAERVRKLEGGSK